MNRFLLALFLEFSGPPHPSRGMEPYIKVRKEAAVSILDCVIYFYDHTIIIMCHYDHDILMDYSEYKDLVYYSEYSCVFCYHDHKILCIIVTMKLLCISLTIKILCSTYNNRTIYIALN